MASDIHQKVYNLCESRLGPSVPLIGQETAKNYSRKMPKILVVALGLLRAHGSALKQQEEESGALVH